MEHLPRFHPTSDCDNYGYENASIDLLPFQAHDDSTLGGVAPLPLSKANVNVIFVAMKHGSIVTLLVLGVRTWRFRALVVVMGWSR